jgi:hypothetical protein
MLGRVRSRDSVGVDSPRISGEGNGARHGSPVVVMSRLGNKKAGTGAFAPIHLTANWSPKGCPAPAFLDRAAA